MGMDSSSQQNKRQGFSLVESAIVLAVVGLVIGGIWVASAKFYEDYKVNKTVEGVLTTARNVQKLISISDSYRIGQDINIIGVIIRSKAVPQDWINNQSAINPFGGIVSVINYTDHDIPHFVIYLAGIPTTGCINSVVKISAFGAMAGSLGDGSQTNRPALSYISINSTDGTRNWYSTTFPVSPEEIREACTITNKNIIDFAFGYTRTN